MKAKKYWFFGIVLALCSELYPSELSKISNEEKAQIETFGTSTLHGLEGVLAGVWVWPRTLSGYMRSFVEGERDEFDAACLSMRTELNKQIQLSLRQAGIETITSDNSDEHTARLQINVIVRKIAADEQVYAFTVHIELNQLVQLTREPKIRTHGVTWPNSLEKPDISFVAGFNNLEKAIRRKVTAQIEKFINDYLAANPKEEKKTVKDEQLIKGTGTIRFSEVEGGFYTIHADTGEEYDPIKLPSSYEKDGLRVKFTVKYRPDMVSIHMNGKIVEILKIERQND